ncbi:MAG: metallophosphoesterase [Bacteroidota bacterium]
MYIRLSIFLLTLLGSYSLVEAQRFAIIGDYGLDGPDEAAVANMVKRWNPEIILTLGDNNYPYGEDSTMDRNIGKHYHGFISPYKGQFGSGASENRFFPTLGNHDDITDNGNPYLDYFELPGNERYYDFVKGDVHFFALNSNESEPSGRDSKSIQALWLKEKLKNSTSKWKVVYFHHPPYSTGDHGETADMQWPFAKWGASIILSGHDHIYERIEVRGLTYIINGVGGNVIYDLHEERHTAYNIKSTYNAGHGAMIATANADSLSFEFHSVTDGLMDSFVLKQEQDKFFSSDEVVEVTIEADMTTLLNDRGDEDRDYHNAKITVAETDGNQSTFPGELKVRGNFRRSQDNCEFPPFWIKFKDRNVAGTIFQGHKRMKIVNPCSVKKDYNQYVMQEYLAYKVYDLLTDSSFKVRPVRIKYVDTQNSKSISAFTFFIEDVKKLGKRLGAKEIEVDPYYVETPNYHNPPTLELFQFMIGNNDWAFPDHNVKPFKVYGTEEHIVVPYDFDLSRLVDAEYTYQDQEKKFRGFCRPTDEFMASFKKFKQQKSNIKKLYEDFVGLDQANKDQALRVMERFYIIINSPKRRQSEIFEKCGDNF